MNHICISSEYFTPWLPIILFVLDTESLIIFVHKSIYPHSVDVVIPPHGAIIRRLYQDIRTSIYKVGRLATAMESDNTLSQYCRRLCANSKVTGDTSYDQQYTLDLQIFGDLSGERKLTQLKAQWAVRCIMDMRLSQGGLVDLSWDFDECGVFDIPGN